MIRSMFKKTYTAKESAKSQTQESAQEEPNIPQGLWRKCNKCRQPIYVDDVKSNFYVCPRCGGYFRVHAYRRIEMLLDEGSFEEWDSGMPFANPLNFPGYEKKVEAAKEKTGLNEAVVTGCGKIRGIPTAFGVCDGRFMMSSMGHVVGEKITRMVERATADGLPVILFACSGGARMQEGMVSLMQMAKTAAALKKHHEAGQLFVSVLTEPTTGGVTASFAMLGDIILAEPGALIGFAGPRVIQQTIGQRLPEGFQRAEFLLDHGFIDRIAERKEQRDVLAEILWFHADDGVRAQTGRPAEPKEETGDVPKVIMEESPQEEPEMAPKEIPASETEETGQEAAAAAEKSAWDIVKISRDASRPVASDFIEAIFDDFMEFHGDRCFGDDGAVIGGLASFQGTPVTVIGQQKGRTTKDNIRRNFGMPNPEGYRKALRLMKQAETFGRPVICFVDTPGAFCGIGAEERGQGEAIARNLFEMSALKVPVVSIVIGEGGSGGALALAVANEVWMLENATYSILSPEGFASILWKDSKKAPEAAKYMKVTASDLLEMKLIERVIHEETPADSDSLPVLAQQLSAELARFLEAYRGMDPEEISGRRYSRFRSM